MKKIILLLYLLLLFSSIAHAEDTESPRLPVRNGSELESLSFDRVFDKMTTEEAAPATNSASSIKFVRIENDIVSGAELIIIVFSTIILVLIVDTSEQLTAAIGILGAIAGYCLFRSVQENGQEANQKPSCRHGKLIYFLK